MHPQNDTPPRATAAAPRRFAILAAIGLGLCFGPAGSATAPAAPPSALSSRLDSILSVSGQPKARLAAKVMELPSGRVLYDRKGRTPMMPASNMKAVIMAAAIDTLGPDYRFSTVVAIQGKNLVVIGGGDPTLGDEKLSAARGEPITAVFHRWAEKLKRSGVKQIPGDLVIDDSVFDDRFVHAHWPADQYQAWYEAPVGGLNFNSNCVLVRAEPPSGGHAGATSMIPGNTYLRIENRAKRGRKTTAVVNRKRGADSIVVSGALRSATTLGPITVRDPGLYFGSVLKTVLAAKGIRVHGAVVRRRIRLADGKIPGDCHIVDVHRGPIADALARAGKNSLGMAAEALLKTLGAERGGGGTWPAGIGVVESYLQKLGIPSAQFQIDDGSGLSRHNRLSPNATIRVLEHMYRAGGKTFELYRTSLARSGIDGSLRKRMRDKNVKGRVYAKTGYIRGVRTLAGYIHTRSNRWLAFAFYYNDARATRPMTRAQDRACKLLVEWPNLPR